ncbi:hypothetical protein SAMN05660686_01775 [Thalassobaculum litoreum DSM 18839]|uniref:CVNH domain-containing protein n=1 Tax=Thalassobaculum litoreum DSM 18839 TaxID=1123362 RepID=A0A8G2EXY8_9PROT|nr:hypothetical protein SAMN05660686_01775 [Thalassobaculum litoreum DSM 18839]
MFLHLRILSAALLFFLGMVTSQDAHAACADPEGNEGEITYNTTYKTMQFCDGSKWWSMKGSITGDSLASKDYVDTAVAAGGVNGRYQLMCTNYGVYYNNITCLRMDTQTGSVICKDRSQPGGGVQWGNCSIPW